MKKKFPLENKAFKNWPGFLPVDALLYKAEYALAGALLFGLLYLRNSFASLDVGATVVFALLPDVVFLAILPFMRKGKWPSWGANLYNFSHSFVVWVFAVAVSWLAFNAFFWPILGWALHVCIDRVIGFNLRARK